MHRWKRESAWFDMKDEMRELIGDLWQNHRCKMVGLLLGLVIGMAILLFGFWNTVFVLLCGLLGLFIGIKLDKGEDFLAHMDRFFPDRFQRW